MPDPDAPIPWSALPDLAPLAALYGMSVADLAAFVAGLPSSLRPCAWVEEDRVVAAVIVVAEDLEGERRLTFARAAAADAAHSVRLLHWVEHTATASDAQEMEISVRRAPGLEDLLGRRGFTRTNATLHLVAGPPRPAGSLPRGFHERSLDAFPLDVVLRMTNTCFAEHPFTAPLTIEDVERLCAAPSFDAGLFRLLADGEGPVGFLRCEVQADGHGEIEAIGVLPRVRGTGLGRWLLRRSEALLAERGATPVSLHVVESNRAALGLYRSEGYVEAERWTVWARTPGPGPTEGVEPDGRPAGTGIQEPQST